MVSIDELNCSRREWVRKAGLLVPAALGLGGSAVSAFAMEEDGDKQDNKEEEEEKVTPAEDLMQEHGLLDRILLIYEEAILRLQQDKEFPPEVLAQSASTVRNFVEDYHEKLEEEFVFPRLEKAGKLAETVKILRQQHDAGRRVTDEIMALIKKDFRKNADEEKRLAELLRQFTRMYRPHESREETEVFPAFRDSVSKNEYDSLGEDFEKREHELFGEEGFEQVVERVKDLEKQMGLNDLAQFTPKA